MQRNSSFAEEAIKHPVPFDPKSLGNNINSDQPEYLPSVTVMNKLLFSLVGLEKDSVRMKISLLQKSEW
jgi:hypothetical protein